MTGLRRRLLAIVAALGLLPAASALAQVAYEVSLPEEVEPPELGTALEASSNLAALTDEPPPSVAGLVRRAEGDLERLRAAMRSYGFYEGEATITLNGVPLDDPELLDRLQRAAEGLSVQVDISVEPGPQYTIESIDLDQQTPGDIAPVEIDRDALPIEVGGPARADRILSAETRMVRQMRRQGRPFAEVPSRRAVVDYATQTMSLTFTLEPGPEATLGPVTLEGLERMEEDFVRRRIPYEPGAPYRPQTLDELRSQLLDLGVFSIVEIEPADRLNAEGQLPVTVQVEERPRRFVGFGFDFSTNEGFGGQVYWGHRNLFGQAETLTIRGEIARVAENAVGDVDRNFSISFNKPDIFATLDQDLFASVAYVDERPDAFEREAFTGTVGISRVITDTIEVSGAFAIADQTVTDAGVTEDFFLLSFPLSFRFDNTDNTLNPTEGAQVVVLVEPFPEFVGSSVGFFRTHATGSTYYDFGTDGDTVLAGRLSVGSITGADTLEIPADRRFYAGGGGSVRGYEFQSIGPEDQFGDPQGGRSLVEVGIEVRQRVLENWGVVGFVDGGNVYESTFPDFEETLRFGAGVGVRYYTSIGPIRLDLGVPINPADRDDQPPVSVYISIGQSF